MRFWRRKKTPLPSSTQAEQWVVHFVQWMVHDLGKRVMDIRVHADSLLKDLEFRSVRTRRRDLERIAHAADELAAGFGMMRVLGSAADQEDCDFIADVLRPALSMASRRRRGPRLAMDPSARNAPNVKLRQGPAFLAVGQLIRQSEADLVKCRAIVRPPRVSFSLELSGTTIAIPERLYGEFDGLLREAGVVDFRFDAQLNDRCVVVSIELETLK